MGSSAASPSGAPMQSWLDMWSEWEIQAVVSVSFGAQVILFFFAGVRRYNASSVLKVFLWLVYLVADAAAIYALGHMSASLSKTSSDKHQLVAFWAPFLLLHLGGQDNITAYALEDNELWLRHLLTMSVQVAGTGYVLHKYIIADRPTIVSAAVFVVVAGVLKYGERIWALKCASKGSNEPDKGKSMSIFSPASIKAAKNCFTRNKKFRNYEFSLMTAHNSFIGFVKPIMIDRDRLDPDLRAAYIIREITDHVDGLLDQRDVLTWDKRFAEEVYRVIEVQLALVYDMLYTKAQVIHTWYGKLFRVISFVSCFRALFAFTRSERDGYNTPDIVISFVLLGGACALEVASAFKVIGSTWTYSKLRRHSICTILPTLWDWLAFAILFVRYHLIVFKDGKWSNSVGQFDFISFCGSDNTRLDRRMAGWIGLKDRWNKAHYTKHTKLSPALKQFVWGLLRGKKGCYSGMVETEDLAIQSGYWGRRLTGFNQSKELDWSLSMDFHDCVFFWHIATSTFLSHPDVKWELVVTSNTGMAESVNTLSDYMMYLLVQHPNIVPMSAKARNLFSPTHSGFIGELTKNSEKHREKGTLDVPHQMILDYMKQGRRPDYVRSLMSGETFHGDVFLDEGVLIRASLLVDILLRLKLDLTHKMVIIGRVWTEMLWYAATNASVDFHARQLSNGGEFLTHILLLKKYCSTTWRVRYGLSDGDQPAEVAVPVEPTPVATGHIELNVYNGRENAEAGELQHFEKNNGREEEITEVG